ncbi:MAG: hypothetical protein ACLF0P_17285 [Thermoanaerobaculia bacterium]
MRDPSSAVALSPLALHWMVPETGSVALGLGLSLLAVLGVRLWIAFRGDRVRVRTRDVSGQVVVADRVEGGVHHGGVHPRRGDAAREAEDRGGTGGRKGLKTLDLVLGIVASMLAIFGAVLTFGGG